MLHVSAYSQLVWNVNAAVGVTSQEVSAEISSTGARIVVEREMFFHYNGHGLAATGGSDTIGRVGPATATVYSFAEGYTNTGYNEWLTLQNPTGKPETINVTLANGLGQSFSQSFQVGAHSRFTIDITGLM